MDNTHDYVSYRGCDEAFAEWRERFARPAQDVRELRADIDAGLIDFAELEIAS